MKFKLNLDPIKLKKLAEDEVMRRLEVGVGPLLVESGRKLVSKGPGGSLAGLKPEQRKAVRVALLRDKNKTGRVPHSKPGDPPFHQSGFLMSNIAFEVDRSRKILVFGVNRAVKYARELEYGDPTRNLKPRPYLRPTVRNNWGKVRRIMGIKE